MEFCKERRRRQAFPRISSREVVKQLAQQWKRMEPLEKAPFERRAALDKTRWRHEMLAYKHRLQCLIYQRALRRI